MHVRDLRVGNGKNHVSNHLLPTTLFTYYLFPLDMFRGSSKLILEWEQPSRSCHWGEPRSKQGTIFCKKSHAEMWAPVRSPFPFLRHVFMTRLKQHRVPVKTEDYNQVASISFQSTTLLLAQWLKMLSNSYINLNPKPPFSKDFGVTSH